MKCCICGKEIEGFGNNPLPVWKDDWSEDARCCNECNWGIVLPWRILEMKFGIKYSEKRGEVSK